jgi:glycerate 2-kinase
VSLTGFEIARGIHDEVLRAVSPRSLIGASCQSDGDEFWIQGLKLDLGAFQRVFVCGAGKASCGLAAELIKLVGSRVSGGLVVTKYGHGLDLGRVSVMEAGHPLVDEASLLAGEAMAQFAAEVGWGDLVLFVLSGGASSLLELLKPGWTLHQIAVETETLLKGGASITELNYRRKDWSRIKGGGLAGMFAGGHTVCLVVSDVIGDDLSTVGSGPLFSPLHPITHLVLGNLETAIQAAVKQAKVNGCVVEASQDWIFSGEARFEAKNWVRRFLDETERPTIWIGGGEPIVRVRGQGLGGRCQEFATAAALELDGVEGVTLLAGSTDGSDGPTPFAGGIVDGKSVGIARLNGVDVETSLENNDSANFLIACGGVVQTGPTQSNVNDVFILVRTV